MKRKFIALLIVFGMLFYAMSAVAGVADFEAFFDIDLEKDEIPNMEDLKKIVVQNDDYNKKYKNFFELLGDFDEEFYVTIAAYGGQEKRIKSETEDFYLEFLNMMPKKYYQYLGPMLFEVPTMSEKILNLPGIKETKNKFPTRIAEQVKDIEDLEFMSPMLYPMLMPEAWPGYDYSIEQPKMTRYYPKIKYNQKFYAALKKLIRPEKFMLGYKDDGKRSKSDLRTLYPTKDSLLTSADIQSFIATIDSVDDWTKKGRNSLDLSTVGILLYNYEAQDGVQQYIPAGIKDLVNPCTRLVQKVRILKKELELASIVAKEGFSLNEWAYTCDKVIKAYRLSNIRSGVVQAIREYLRGVHDEEIKGMSAYTQNVRYAVMQSIIQAHKAPISDVVEMKKNRQKFKEKLEQRKFRLFGYLITKY